jgi:hypothetical protein
LPSHHACHGSRRQIACRAGQIVSLFARRAGVHVDFHAHRHFDNLRGLPGHAFLPNRWPSHRRKTSANLKRRAAARLTQVSGQSRAFCPNSTPRSMPRPTIAKSLSERRGACGYFSNRNSALPAALFSSLASSVPSLSGSAAWKRCSTTAAYSSAVSVPS